MLAFGPPENDDAARLDFLACGKAKQTIMDMSRKQKQILGVGLLLAALLLLFPPWMWEGTSGTLGNFSKMDTDAWGIAYGTGLSAPPVVLTPEDCQRMNCGDPPRTAPVLILRCYPLIAAEMGSLAFVIGLLLRRSRHTWPQEK